MCSTSFAKGAVADRAPSNSKRRDRAARTRSRRATSAKRWQLRPKSRRPIPPRDAAFQAIRTSQAPRKRECSRFWVVEGGLGRYWALRLTHGLQFGAALYVCRVNGCEIMQEPNLQLFAVRAAVSMPPLGHRRKVVCQVQQIGRGKRARLRRSSSRSSSSSTRLESGREWTALRFPLLALLE
jgi:hypothetical protein